MKVINCNDPHFIPSIKWCLDYIFKFKTYNLDIDICTLTAARKKKIYGDLTYKGNIGIFCHPKSIWINSGAFLADKHIVIFHELRHFYQFKTKMWTRESMINDSIVSRDQYYNFPWEIDARSFDINAFEQAIQSGVIDIPISVMKLMRYERNEKRI